MPRVIVETDDGRRVSTLDLPAGWSIFSLGRHIYGIPGAPLGWLGRAIEDARAVEDGRDPERPSEKVMRVLSEREG
jgi:hypothetical protein